MIIERAGKRNSSHGRAVAIAYRSDSGKWFLSEWQEDFLGNYHRKVSLRSDSTKKTVMGNFDNLLKFKNYREIRPEILTGKFWNINQFQ